MFIKPQRSENSPATTQNSLAKFRLLPERVSLFHNNSPVTLPYSPATTILIENPGWRTNREWYRPKRLILHFAT